MKTCGIPISHILLSRKLDPWNKQVIQPDQDMHVCVCGGWRRDSSEDHVWFEDRWMVASLCDE
jgi:hypothetical protein